MPFMPIRERTRSSRAPLVFAFVAGALVTLAPRAALADGFDDVTRSKLAEALRCVNLSVADLGWDKRPIDDPFRLSCVSETLDRPLALSMRAELAEGEFASDPVASSLAAARWLDIDAAPPARVLLAEAPLPREFAGSRELVGILVDARARARAALRQALAPLSEDERKLVETVGVTLYTDESEEDRDLAPIIAAIRKVDVASLVRAGIILADATQRIRDLLAAVSFDTSAWRSATHDIGGVRVSIGGAGADVHEADIAIDAGGEDTYRRCGFVVDLGGDDTYRDSGSGRLDVGLVLDVAGDDRHLGGDFTQGGASLGAALLIDVAGDDRYEAGQVSQGAASCGVGMLFDLAGNDSYRGARFVQGFGGVRGLGALSDVAGQDTYYAGGRFSHAPLLPENFQSLSQGFGFGLRPDASGGVGILADHAGNDVYSAEVFGQGASYWFALGVLVDSGGHDFYNLYQYGQGAGIHLSPAVLFDRAGNDAYSCLNGVAQGSGHDWGVGLLWDLAGNDGYQGSGMSQGGVNANGVGMIVDRAGNDTYAGWNERNQGDSFFSRGTMGLGVLLDLGGKDRYTHGGKDDATWTRGTVGVGLDWAGR